MEWEKIEGQPMSTTHDFNEKSEFVGIYQGNQSNVGENNSNVYNFLAEGEPVSIWGSAVLDSRLANLTGGEEVKIVYEGMAEGKNGRNYKDYSVYIKK